MKNGFHSAQCNLYSIMAVRRWSVLNKQDSKSSFSVQIEVIFTSLPQVQLSLLHDTLTLGLLSLFHTVYAA